MKYLLQMVCRVLLVSAVIAGSAMGQKSFAVAIGGGAAVPVGKLSRTQDAGYNGIIAVAMGVAELPVGVRIDGIYNNLLRNKQLSPGGTISSDLRVMGLLGNLIFAFSGTSAKPYMIIGGGVYNVRPDTTAAKSANHFGVSAGLGATFGIGPFATFVESRYHSISRKTAKGGVMQFVPITVGFMF